MSAFYALVRKDILQFLGSRRALVITLLAPIAIAAFFGSLFDGQSGRPSRVPVALTVLDDSATARAITAALQADPAFQLRLLDAAAASAAVQQGHVRAWVTVPAGFGAAAHSALFSGRARPELPLLVDPSQAAMMPMVTGLLTQHVMAAIGQGLPGGGSGGTMTLPFTLRTQEAAVQTPGAGYNSYAHAFAGMGVQFILLMGVDFGIGLLALRQQGLWKRLRAAPLSRLQLLGSRMASCALIASGVFAVLFAVAIAGFGVRVHGSAAGLALVVVTYGLMTGAFGLMLAAVGRTAEATRGLAILATLVLVMLGGAWVPSFIFPPWLQQVSAMTPTHWALQGMDGMTWRGLPFSAALLPAGLLLAFAAGFAALALARFRWHD